MACSDHQWHLIHGEVCQPFAALPPALLRLVSGRIVPCFGRWHSSHEGARAPTIVAADLPNEH